MKEWRSEKNLWKYWKKPLELHDEQKILERGKKILRINSSLTEHILLYYACLQKQSILTNTSRNFNKKKKIMESVFWRTTFHIHMHSYVKEDDTITIYIGRWQVFQVYFSSIWWKSKLEGCKKSLNFLKMKSSPT